VYLANALEDQSQSVSILAFTGFISLVFTMGASMLMPQMVATMGTTREGWAKIALLITIPCTLVGLIRFMVVKERSDVIAAAASNNKITVKDMLHLLAQNKYILIFAGIILVSNIGSNIANGVGTYYYLYIMHDIGLASVMSLAMLAIIFVIILTPVLSKKFGFMKIMRTTTLIGCIGYLIRLVSLESIPLLFASSLLSLMGFNTMFSFAGSFVINCMDYGEWKNGVRSEGTISSAQSFTAKIGSAVGAGLIGVLMGIAGYNGGVEVQARSAQIMIVMLNTVIPAMFCLVQYVLLRKFDLGDEMEQIQAELAERRAQHK
ncbi:MAG: MFS transporter, partial [Lachnospiraceae bacterium]|nr:MFS transporter [Lachnospiraceae bacterium]